MDKNIEKEYKILLTKQQFEKLSSFYEPLTFKNQVNVYYDTHDNKIRSLKGAMRIRTKEGQHTFTLKMFSEEGLQEFECSLKENSLLALNNKEITLLLENYNIQGPFQTIATLSTNRAIVETEEAELCFDISEYNDTSDYEIEYEYKKEHNGLEIFNKILSKINVHYDKNCSSKIARALRTK